MKSNEVGMPKLSFLIWDFEFKWAGPTKHGQTVVGRDVQLGDVFMVGGSRRDAKTSISFVRITSIDNLGNAAWVRLRWDQAAVERSRRWLWSELRRYNFKIRRWYRGLQHSGKGGPRP